MKNYTSATCYSYGRRASYVFAFLSFWAPINTCIGADCNATLKDDYKRLMDHDNQLQTTDSTQQKKLNTLKDETKPLQSAWGICSNGRWRTIFESTINKAEENRIKLEDAWEKLVSYDHDLEVTKSKLDQLNIRIDHKFKKKCAFQYEQAFRAYMSEYDNDYIYLKENIYEHKLESYITGIEAYQSFIKSSAKACQENDFTPFTLDTLKGGANKILESVENLSLKL